MGESGGAILLTSLQLSEWVEACLISAFPSFWSLANKEQGGRGGCHYHQASGRHAARQALYSSPPSDDLPPPSSVVKQVVMFNNLVAGSRGKWVGVNVEEMKLAARWVMSAGPPSHLQTLKCPSHQLPRITMDLSSSDGFPPESLSISAPLILTYFSERWIKDGRVQARCPLPKASCCPF